MKKASPYLRMHVEDPVDDVTDAGPQPPHRCCLSVVLTPPSCLLPELPSRQQQGEPVVERQFYFRAVVLVFLVCCWIPK